MKVKENEGHIVGQGYEMKVKWAWKYIDLIVCNTY
jgi:hypothetical protein